MTKQRIVIDVEGGLVQEVYTPEDSDIEVEIRDWDCGLECTGCGKYVSEDDLFSKIVPDMAYWPRDVVVKAEYELCPKCAEKRGLTLNQRHIRITPSDMLMDAIERLDKLGEGELDDIVRDLKSQEASEINNGDLDAQVKYLLKCGIKPQDLEEML